MTFAEDERGQRDAGMRRNGPSGDTEEERKRRKRGRRAGSYSHAKLSRAFHGGEVKAARWLVGMAYLHWHLG